MFNFNLYCFCPDLISEKISEPEFFIDVLLPSTVNSPHHLLLDDSELLWLEYLERAGKNKSAFDNLNTWRKSLERKGNKVLFSKVDKSMRVDENFLAEIAINAPSTSRRYIVTNKNDNFLPDLQRLKSQSVHLISEFNIVKSSEYEFNGVSFNKHDFLVHLIHAISFVVYTRRNKLENEHNDYLRDLLKFKGYEVQDQPRLGSSGSGKGVGNLDLVITQGMKWLTIIEPLRLTSVDKGNITSHCEKLIFNYNPLMLVSTYLVVYYIGNPSGFKEFYAKYYKFVSELSPLEFSSTVDFESVSDVNCDYDAVLAFTQHGNINGSKFQCNHVCVSFSE
ncbi:hypothetical protein GCM10027181_23010 [Rheinheimera gaetbuli]